jgi:hypothetical protein
LGAPSTASVTRANCATTVQAWGVPEGVRFAVTVDLLNGLTNASPLRPDNVRFFLDGEFATDIYDIAFGGGPRFGRHTIAAWWGTAWQASTTRLTIMGHVRLSLLRDRSRGKRTLVVRLFDAQSSNQEIATLTVQVDLDAAYATRPIIRSMFNLTVDEVASTAGLAAAVKAAGVNAIYRGVYANPADNSFMTDYSSWAGYSISNKLLGGVEFALGNDFLFYAVGDDFFRTGGERNWINTGAYADQSIRDTAYILQTYGGVVDRIDWFDEAPGDPTADPAYAKVVADWRAYGGPRGGWPMVELTSVFPTLWETPQWADYATRYPRPFLDWRPGLAEGPTFFQYADGAYLARKDAQSSGRRLPDGWELVWKLDCSGPFYTKNAVGGDYNAAGGDVLQNPGTRPAMIVASTWVGLAYGANHFRMYAYDWSLWQAERQNSALGTIDRQTGSRPGDVRWPAVSTAYGSVALYEKRLQSGPATFVRRDNWLKGENGALQWYVNLSERALAVPGLKEGVLITPATGAAGKKYDGSPVPGGGVVVREL